MSISAKLIRESVFLPSKWPMPVINIAFHYSIWKASPSHPPPGTPPDLALALLNRLPACERPKCRKSTRDPCWGALKESFQKYSECLLCGTTKLDQRQTLWKGNREKDKRGCLKQPQHSRECWSHRVRTDLAGWAAWLTDDLGGSFMKERWQIRGPL